MAKYANVKADFVNGDLYFYDSAKNEICHIEGSVGGGGVTFPGLTKCQRLRFTTAQINAGATVLAAVAGLKYRLIGLKVIAIGGNASGLTLLTLTGTQATAAVLLATFTQAALTRSTPLSTESTGAVVLADGVSFVPNDVNTGITIQQTGSSLATATAIDVIITYALEE